MPYSVAVDASALLPCRALTHVAVLRLAAGQVYLPRWSADVLDDLRLLYRERYPAEPVVVIEKIIDRLGVFEDAFVPAASRASRFSPPRRYRVPFYVRHALAAADRSRADAVLTARPWEYPVALADDVGVVVQGLDEFLCNQLELTPHQVRSTFEHWSQQSLARGVRPATVDAILDVMHEAVPQFAAEARALIGTPRPAT